MSSKRALITGITGQDGSYLAEFLLNKDYEVFGLIRRTSTVNLERIKHIEEKITLISGNVLDQNSLINAIKESNPDEVYNLAGQSFVPTSWKQPVFTGEATGLGVARMLEAIRAVNPKIKFFQPSSGEMFGRAKEFPQTEKTPFHPRSPYGVAKLYGHWIAVNYRESYNMFCCCAIQLNHESPRRGLEFVTRKVTNTAARIKLGLAKELRLGNLDAKRDWGFAGDYVKAMWLMLQQEKPDDYLISTGINHSVRDLVKVAFDYVNLNWKDYVVIDPKFFRPAEIEFILGNSTKALKKLGWAPKTSFEELIKMMVDADLERVENDIKLFNLNKNRK
jgi:GDPmannose 4,6-dehydratase